MGEAERAVVMGCPTLVAAGGFLVEAVEMKNFMTPPNGTAQQTAVDTLLDLVSLPPTKGNQAPTKKAVVLATVLIAELLVGGEAGLALTPNNQSPVTAGAAGKCVGANPTSKCGCPGGSHNSNSYCYCSTLANG